MMILNFGAKNFFSFKEGFDISFELGGGCPIEISNGKSVSNILCIKGANGSGKTNILKGINFLSDFIAFSFNYAPDGYLPIDPYFNSEEDSEFYVNFHWNGTTYRYEVVMTDTEVKRETLYRKVKRETKVIERIGDTVTYTLSEYKDLKKIKMRKNVSLFSMAKQYDVKCIDDVYDTFSKVLTNVGYIGLRNDKLALDYIDKFYYNHPEVFKFVKEIIIKFDPSISDVYINKNTGEDGTETFKTWFAFEFDGQDDVLGLNHQSSGTKSLYKQLGNYKVVLGVGGLLVLDEFDINLHPHILPHLLDVFLNESSNPYGAQLIFTTHNTEIMDFLGKHRTYLVNKNHTESYCYRLDEIPSDILRNDRPITPSYNQGKIGGVPNL